MKIIKYLLLVIVLVISGALIYSATYTSKYNVKRSKIIKAEPYQIFNVINDLNTGKTWGPWMKEDTTIVVTNGDKNVGVGANYTWTSRQGPGRMETISLETNKSIQQKLQFGDFEPTDVYWEFKRVKQGTEVTWGMKCEKAPFMFKAIAAFSGGWDIMFGKMEEDGLQNIDDMMKQELTAFRMSKIVKMAVSEQKFIGYPHKIKINHKEMQRLFMVDMPKAGIYAMQQKLSPTDYTPASVYSKYDEESGDTEFYIGLIINKDIVPAEGMVRLDLPMGEALKISKFGNYGSGDVKAHEAIDANKKAQKVVTIFPIWEIYANDPMSVRTINIQTDIYYPIK